MSNQWSTLMSSTDSRIMELRCPTPPSRPSRPGGRREAVRRAVCRGGPVGADRRGPARFAAAVVRRLDCADATDVAIGRPGDPISSGLYDAERRPLGRRPRRVARLRQPDRARRAPPGGDVLDLGSGGGLDVLLSARRVAPGGTAYGVDMTPEMLELARRNQARGGRRERASSSWAASRTSRCPTARSTSSSPTASSTSRPTRTPSSPRPSGCSAPVAGSRSPTSSCSGPCPSS